MKLNLTTVLLLGIIGIVAWKMAGGLPVLGAGGGSPQAHPAGGTTQTGQQDVFQSLLGAATSIYNAVTAVAQTQSKTA